MAGSLDLVCLRLVAAEANCSPNWYSRLRLRRASKSSCLLLAPVFNDSSTPLDRVLAA